MRPKGKQPRSPPLSAEPASSSRLDAQQAEPLADLALALVLPTLAVSAGLLLLRPLTGLSAAGFTSVFQGGIRFNTYIGIACADALYGDAGLVIAAVVLAIMIPLVNLLGHQSWHGSVGKLLEVYPELDETPWVLLPEEHTWPNPDRLCCKSYCPLHPRVHGIVFSMVDEIADAFEAHAFH